MTLKDWYLFAEKALCEAGFDNPSKEAKWLLSGALKQEGSFVTLNPTYLPSLQEERIFREWLERRLKGEPLSRLKEIREFWSLPFHLNEYTLDPRPETEILVEGVLNWIGNCTAYPWRILDLGTGSGCILIALLHELKKATGIGVDLNEEALDMARFNADLNGVAPRTMFYKSNWGEDLKEPFDIIVSNPPYIPLKDKIMLSKNVLNFDPPVALFGGEDGLMCYHALMPSIKRLLAPKGLAAFEIGCAQRKDVEILCHAEGFRTLFILQDLANIERVIGIKLCDAESFL